MVRDNLVYEDDTDKTKGYQIKKGSKRLATKSVNLQKGRGKKVLRLVNDTRSTNNHRSNLFGNCRITSKRRT